MALGFNIGGSLASAPASARLASRAELAGHFLLTTSLVASKRNLAGGADLTELGAASPAYGDGYAQVASTNGSDAGFDTHVRPGHDMTLMAIISNNNGAGRCPVLAMVSPFTGFVGFANNRIDAYNFQSGSHSNVADIALGASTNYRFAASVLPFAGLSKVFLGDPGDPETEDHIVRDATYTASTTYVGYGPALSSNGAGLYDGVSTGASSAFATDQAVDSEIEIALPESRTIASVKVKDNGDGGWGAAYLNSCLVEASNDGGATWPFSESVGTAAGGTLRTIDLVGGTYNTIRLRQPANNWLSVSEFYAETVDSTVIPATEPSLLSATAETVGGTNRGSGTFFIGTNDAGQGQGTIRVAEVAIYHRLLTEEELLETYLRQLALRADGPVVLA